MIRLLVCSASVGCYLAPHQAAAQQPAAPWVVLLPPSARSAALGGVSTALWGDAATVFVNASGVAIIRHVGLEAMASRLPDPTRQSNVAGAVRVGKFHLAAGYQQLDMAEGSPQESNAMALGSVIYRFGLFGLSAAVKDVSVRDSASITSSATTVDASVIVAIFDIAALSLSVQNIGHPQLNDELLLPTTTRLGSSLNLVDPQGTGRLMGTLEVVWTEGFATRSIIGGEAGLVFGGWGAVLRAGYSSRGPLEGQSLWSFGCSLVLGLADIDYAYQQQSVFGGEAHRLGLRLIL